MATRIEFVGTRMIITGTRKDGDFLKWSTSREDVNLIVSVIQRMFEYVQSSKLEIEIVKNPPHIAASIVLVFPQYQGFHKKEDSLQRASADLLDGLSLDEIMQAPVSV